MVQKLWLFKSFSRSLFRKKICQKRSERFSKQTVRKWNWVWSLTFMYLQRRVTSGHTVQVWRDLYGHGYHNPVCSSKCRGPSINDVVSFFWHPPSHEKDQQWGPLLYTWTLTSIIGGYTCLLFSRKKILPACKFSK